MKKQSEFDEARAKVLDAQSEAEQLLNQKPKNIELIGDPNPSRRSLLKTLGVSAVLVALGGQAFAMLRSLFPNVLYEPPQKFKLGVLDKFTEGGTFLEGDRLFVFREKNTFHAISAACTHLGCTVKIDGETESAEKGNGRRKGDRGAGRISLSVPWLEVLRRRNELRRAGTSAARLFQSGGLSGRRTIDRR